MGPKRTDKDVRRPADEGEIIFRPWFRTRNGRIVRASEYGKKCWPIRIRRKRS